MRYDHLELLPYRAFSPVGKHMTLEGKGGKGDSPDSPDYTAAAEATAAGNLEAARVAAMANRVNQYTPQGNLEYTQDVAGHFDQSGYDRAYDSYQDSLSKHQSSAGSNAAARNAVSGLWSGIGGSSASAPAPVAPNRDDFYSAGNPDKWSVTQTLSPDEQAKYDKNNALSIGFLDTAQKGLAGVDEQLSKGFDWDALPASQINAGQTAQDAIMQRLDPQFQQSEDQLRTRLRNQGVVAGSEAWDNEFRNYDNRKNDAYSQAALYGIDVGNEARARAIQEQEFGRTEGLNIVNALRTGTQMQAPNFTQVPQQATTAGADILGATQAGYQSDLGAYNAQQSASNGFLGGLGSLAGAGIQAWQASDINLKTKIRKIGQHIKGFGIYAYEKFGRYEIGVLAQEVQKFIPEAVKRHPNGYLMVDYGRVG